jgi:PucR family transcriptional regulator, purine catabolism regulatory protein
MAQALMDDAPDVDAYRLLVEQVIAGQGLSGVVRLLADMLGLPATITNEDLEPLHGFAPRGKQLTTDEAALPDDVRSLVTFDLASEPRASTAPPTLTIPSGDGQEYAVAPVVLPTGILGYLWAADPSGHISARVRDVVAHAAAACTVEMMRQRAMIEGESRVRSSFLEDLLTGAISSVNGTRRRARFLGYDLRGGQVVFALDLDRFSSFIEAHRMDEGGIQQLKERFRRSLDASIPAVWSRTLIWEHSDSLIVLAPSGKNHTPQALRERVESIRAKVEAKLAGPSVSAGVGRVTTDLTKLQDSYREAEHALTIGAAVHGISHTSSFEELGVYRLLYHLRDQPELDLFCEESIGALERYDLEHGTTLVETLGTLLHLQGNLSQTARELHLHRNGLLYRLSRIEAIAGCDLDDPSQRLSLQLAFLARPLIRRKRGA